MRLQLDRLRKVQMLDASPIFPQLFFHHVIGHSVVIPARRIRRLQLR